MTKQHDDRTTSAGNRLAALRKARGLTQEQLATVAGVSRRRIAYYERETQHPPTTILPCLAEVLGVTTDELLGANIGQSQTEAKRKESYTYPTFEESDAQSDVREVYHEDYLQVIQGDSREALRGINDRTFRCCITSPPYWGLRDYGYDGQIDWCRANTRPIYRGSSGHFPRSSANTGGRRYAVAEHRGLLHERKLKMARQRRQESCACDDISSADAVGLEAKGLDRGSLAFGTCLTGRRLVSAFGYHME